MIRQIGNFQFFLKYNIHICIIRKLYIKYIKWDSKNLTNIDTIIQISMKLLRTQRINTKINITLKILITKSRIRTHAPNYVAQAYFIFEFDMSNDILLQTYKCSVSYLTDSRSTCSTQCGVVADGAPDARQLSAALVDTAVCGLVKVSDDQCHVTLACLQLASVVCPSHIEHADGHRIVVQLQSARESDCG